MQDINESENLLRKFGIESIQSVPRTSCTKSRWKIKMKIEILCLIAIKLN